MRKFDRSFGPYKPSNQAGGGLNVSVLDEDGGFDIYLDLEDEGYE